MEIDDIITEISRTDNTFPHQALVKAVNNPDLITPSLLNILEEACDNKNTFFQEKGYEDSQLKPHGIEIIEGKISSPQWEGYKAHVYAMLLLAQFREEKAYPLIIKFLLTYGKKFPHDFNDSFISEDLHLVLAAVSCGDTSLIEELVENSKVDEFIRSAGIRALLTLVVSGQKTRDDIISYYQSLFREKLLRKPSYIWDELINCCIALYPDSLFEDILSACELPAEFYKSDLEQKLSNGIEKASEELFSDPEYFPINAIEDIKRWYCFKNELLSSKNHISTVNPTHINHKPYINPNKKVGRNDPCPCGSNKKYKKCCG